MTTQHKLAVCVHGGFACGQIINQAIQAVVGGCPDGVELIGLEGGLLPLGKGTRPRVIPLTADVVRGIELRATPFLGLGRNQPPRTPEVTQAIVDFTRELGIDGYVFIGGNGSACTGRQLEQVEIPSILIGKTADADLCLPHGHDTISFWSVALKAATGAVGLKATAASYQHTTDYWVILQVMGRDCGELAEAAAIEARQMGRTNPNLGFDPTVDEVITAERFMHLLDKGRKVPFGVVVDMIVSTILLRRRQGIGYGLVLISEGIGEAIDEATCRLLREAPRDSHGGRVYAKIDLAALLATHVHRRLSRMRLGSVRVVPERRSASLMGFSPLDSIHPRDIVLAESYGAAAVPALLRGQTGAIYIEDGRAETVPYADLTIDEGDHIRTGTRMVDVNGPRHAQALEGTCPFDPRLLQNGAIGGLANDLGVPERLLRRFAERIAAYCG